MVDRILREHSSAAGRRAGADLSISEMEQAIAELEARLTPAQRFEYYECIAQGEPRFDALSAILSTR